MATFDLSIGYDDPEEIRALYQALNRAAAEELTEVNRLGRLRATGYTVASEAQFHRAEARLTEVRLLATFCRGSMRAAGIEPW